MKSHYDVIVAGGGSAGIIAAIQSARAGASTLLIEKSGMLGGTMTVAGISVPASFFSWDRQVIGGIGFDLVCAALKEEGRTISGPVGNGQGWCSHVAINAAIYAALCDSAVIASGAELLFHVMPATVQRQNDCWRVQLCTKTGLCDVQAKVLIDATGDANLVSLAGFDLEHHEPLQPGTLSMHCDGFGDLEKLDYQAIDSAVDAAIQDGQLKLTDFVWAPNSIRSYLNARGHNCNHIDNPGAHTSAGRTAAEIEGRASMLRLIRFLRGQKGLENFTIPHCAPEVAIRDSAVIRGKTRITGEDYLTGRHFHDALCYSWYPKDIHLSDGKGIDYENLAPGVLPTIPRGALLPEGSRFIAAAGRCISGDRVSHSAFRVQATCMAVGQAAGAMAALSVSTNIDLADLPLADIRSLLKEHGAIVP